MADTIVRDITIVVNSTENTASRQGYGGLDMNDKVLPNLANAVDGTDATNKDDLDAAIDGVTLAQALVNGNTTSGNDIVVSNGDKITSPNNASGVPINIQPSGGDTSGGDLNLDGGDSSFGDGGNVNITGGNGPELQGGDINITGGIANGNDGVGGDVFVTAGRGGTSSGSGGNVDIVSGNVGNNDELSGHVNILTAPGGISGGQGVVTLQKDGGRVAIGATTSISSAVLNVESDDKGFMQPRLTTTQRDAISSPTAGLSIYNTTTELPNFFDGVAWREPAISSNQTYRSVIADTTTTADDQVLVVNSLPEFPGGGNRVISLLDETVPANEIRELLIYDGTGHATVQQAIELVTTGGQTIEGLATAFLVKAGGDIKVSLSAGSTDWKIIGSNNHNTALELNFDINTFPTNAKMLYSFPEKYAPLGIVTMELWWDNLLKQPYLVANLASANIFTAGYEMRRNDIPVIPLIAGDVLLNSGTYYFTSDGLPDTASDYIPLGSGGELTFSFSCTNGNIMPHVVTMKINGSMGGTGSFSGSSLTVSIRNAGLPIQFS